MTTKKLYKILDKILLRNRCYNLRKVRNWEIWRVRMWKSSQFDKLGITAPYIQDFLHPESDELDVVKTNFLNICKAASKC